MKGEKKKKMTNKIKDVRFRNLGTINKNEVCIKGENKNLILYFSYKTLVGFSGKKTIALKNYWGCTTGKLLNTIEKDKKKRVNKKEFKKLLDYEFKHLLK
jgi:hypothetical protein